MNEGLGELRVSQTLYYLQRQEQKGDRSTLQKWKRIRTVI